MKVIDFISFAELKNSYSYSYLNKCSDGARSSSTYTDRQSCSAGRFALKNGALNINNLQTEGWVNLNCCSTPERININNKKKIFTILNLDSVECQYNVNDATLERPKIKSAKHFHIIKRVISTKQ